MGAKTADCAHPFGISSPIVTVAIVALWKPTPEGLVVLITRRAEQGHLPGLWELPGGKVHPDESPAEAAARELMEETHLRSADLQPFGVFTHQYSDRAVRIHAFEGPAEPDRNVQLNGPVDFRWIAPAQLSGVDMPAANQPIIAQLVGRLSTYSDAKYMKQIKFI